MYKMIMKKTVWRYFLLLGIVWITLPTFSGVEEALAESKSILSRYLSKLEDKKKWVKRQSKIFSTLETYEDQKSFLYPDPAHASFLCPQDNLKTGIPGFLTHLNHGISSNQTFCHDLLSVFNLLQMQLLTSNPDQKHFLITHDIPHTTFPTLITYALLKYQQNLEICGGIGAHHGYQMLSDAPVAFISRLRHSGIVLKNSSDFIHGIDILSEEMEFLASFMRNLIPHLPDEGKSLFANFLSHPIFKNSFLHLHAYTLRLVETRPSLPWVIAETFIQSSRMAAEDALIQHSIDLSNPSLKFDIQNFEDDVEDYYNEFLKTGLIIPDYDQLISEQLEAVENLASYVSNPKAWKESPAFFDDLLKELMDEVATEFLKETAAKKKKNKKRQARRKNKASSVLVDIPDPRPESNQASSSSPMVSAFSSLASPTVEEVQVSEPHTQDMESESSEDEFYEPQTTTPSPAASPFLGRNPHIGFNTETLATASPASSRRKDRADYYDPLKEDKKSVPTASPLLKRKIQSLWETLWDGRTKMMKWRDFEGLLTQLGFVMYDESKSSSRKFVHPAKPSHPICVHWKHGGANPDTIGPDAIGDVCARLTDIFGWTLASFQPS